jgi:hypothetical protein
MKEHWIPLRPSSVYRAAQEGESFDAAQDHEFVEWPVEQRVKPGMTKKQFENCPCKLMTMRYGFKKICMFAWLGFFICAAGCTVKYVDTVTIFEIKGEVYGEESQRPVENAAVYFMDTGYDYVRSKKPFLVPIGHSDMDGKFTARLNYLWRRRDHALLKPPPRTFDVVLSHAEYEPRRFHFDASDLEQGGMRFEINLDRVYLRPKKMKKK